MGRGVKREHREVSSSSASASVPGPASNDMAPPSRKRRLEDLGDSQSVARSFIRSHAREYIRRFLVNMFY